MEESLIGHLELAAVFAFVGGIISWIAARNGFFRLPPSCTSPLQLSAPITGFFAYIIIFLFVPTFILRLLTWIYSPLRTLFENHPALLIGTAQLLSIMLISSFVIVYSLCQEQGVIPEIWKSSSSRSSLITDFAIGLVTWIISFPIVTFVDQIGNLFTSWIFGPIELEQLAVRFVRQSGESPFLLIVAITSTLIAAPILEECIFRGFIQTYLKSKFSLKFSLIGSSLIFALFHLSPEQGVANFSLVISLFVLALYLGFLYERQRSLLAPIALHMTFNSISVMRILLI